MSKTYLLEIAFGPVQGFIASARRSRDMWAGSHILSELARAAGKELLKHKAELIYPLNDRVEQNNEDENSNLSNVLLAKVMVDDEQAVRNLVNAVKQAAQDRLNKFSDEGLKEWEKHGVRKEIWDAQVNDAIESFAAWAELEGDAYRDAYDRLKRTFAARKNTRNFNQMNGFAGIPKSSFDGLRESVLPKGRKNFPAKFGMSAGEQLDALGAIKRVVGKQEKFTALTRLAADGWLQSLKENDLHALREAYEPLVKLDIATRAIGNVGVYGSFPFDAALLYPERLERAKLEAEEIGEGETELAALEKLLKPIWRKYGQPCPYAVLVVADGDRMGKFVDKAQSEKDHEKISSSVAKFADSVPLIARQHRGQCVFNGGEDLTVMFPLSGVVSGARALAESFEKEMAGIIAELKANSEDAKPTLRVGAAICHVLEPLGVIRANANAAEKFAKGEAGAAGQGNALGLRLHVRAGHDIGVRLSFDDCKSFDDFEAWQKAYKEGKVPGRLGYDMRAIAMHSELIGVNVDVAEAEFLRLLSRSRERGGDAGIADEIKLRLIERQKHLRKQPDNADPSGLFRLANELIVARWLSANTARDVSALEGGDK